MRRRQFLLQDFRVIFRSAEQVTIDTLEIAIDFQLLRDFLDAVDRCPVAFDGESSTVLAVPTLDLGDAVVDRVGEVGRRDARHAARQRTIFHDDTLFPCFPSRYAVVRPAMPPPIIQTSASASRSNLRMRGSLALAGQSSSILRGVRGSKSFHGRRLRSDVRVIHCGFFGTFPNANRIPGKSSTRLPGIAVKSPQPWLQFARITDRRLCD